MLVNRIELYDGKMTVLCNAQDSHFDVDLDEISSSKDWLVDLRGLEPLTSALRTRRSPN